MLHIYCSLPISVIKNILIKFVTENAISGAIFELFLEEKSLLETTEDRN